MYIYMQPHVKHNVQYHILGATSLCKVYIFLKHEIVEMDNYIVVYVGNLPWLR